MGLLLASAAAEELQHRWTLFNCWKAVTVNVIGKLSRKPKKPGLQSGYEDSVYPIDLQSDSQRAVDP